MWNADVNEFCCAHMPLASLAIFKAQGVNMSLPLGDTHNTPHAAEHSSEWCTTSHVGSCMHGCARPVQAKLH
jgi:hypothetical protein